MWGISLSLIHIYISYFAKKAGKAVVSFDVYCDGKFVQTCSISVIAKGYKFYKPVIKNVKYAGKELYYYDPFTNKTSGKLKVTPAKGYKIVSIEYSTGLNAKTGDYTYKKIKNNGKIKLLKQRKYTRKYNEGTEYESQYEMCIRDRVNTTAMDMVRATVTAMGITERISSSG